MYYQTIKELPYGRWIEAHNGNLSVLRRHDVGTKKKDAQAFEKLLNEYILMFGFGEQFKVLWKKKTELAELNQEYLSDFMNKRHLLTEIEILEKEIVQLESESTKGDLMDVIVELRRINVNVDLEKDSVVFVEKLIRAK